MNCSKAQMQKLDSIQGKLIKQSLELSKRAMNISNVKSIEIEMFCYCMI